MKDKGEKKEKKVEETQKIESGAKVMLVQSHGPLVCGEYEVDGFNAAGDVTLKTDKGRINVPLEKIEVINPSKKESKVASRETKQPKNETASPVSHPNKKAEQMELGDKDNPFTMDRLGQITIKDLDTPLGKLAKNIIAAQREITKLENQLVEDNDVMMKEMFRLDKKTIVVMGYKMDYIAPKQTSAKLVVKELE